MIEQLTEFLQRCSALVRKSRVTCYFLAAGVHAIPFLQASREASALKPSQVWE